MASSYEFLTNSNVKVSSLLDLMFSVINIAESESSNREEELEREVGAAKTKIAMLESEIIKFKDKEVQSNHELFRRALFAEPESLGESTLIDVKEATAARDAIAVYDAALHKFPLLCISQSSTPVYHQVSC